MQGIIFVFTCVLTVKVKEGHTRKERRQGAYLHFICGWACRSINHYCLWCIASAMPNLQLPSQPMLVLILPIHRGMARLSFFLVAGYIPR